MEIQGASAELNPNSGDLPSYGTLSSDPVHDDQQVMGAQSTATQAQESRSEERRESERSRGLLDMDGETTAVRAEGVQETARPSVGGSVLRNPGSLLNGTSGTVREAEARTSRMGHLFSEVTAAVNGVVKASSGVRAQIQPQPQGPGSAGTVRTTGSGYVTAISEEDGEQPPGMVATDVDSSVPLFTTEQVERLETMAKAAPWIYPETQALPELPHSVSSGSRGEAIQMEVRRQLQQFLAVQSDLERRVVQLQRENDALRRGEVGNGMDQGVRGWLGGLGRGLMGFVHQSSAKAGAPILTASTVTSVTHVNQQPIQGPSGAPPGILTPALIQAQGAHQAKEGQAQGAYQAAAGQTQGAYQAAAGQAQGPYQAAAGQAQGPYQAAAGQAQGAYRCIPGCRRSGARCIPGCRRSGARCIPGCRGSGARCIPGCRRSGARCIPGCRRSGARCIPGCRRSGARRIPEQVQGALQAAAGQVQGAYQAAAGQVQGAYRAAAGQMQGAYQNAAGQVQDAHSASTGQAQGAYQVATGQVPGAYQVVAGQVQGAIQDAVGQPQAASKATVGCAPGACQGGTGQVPIAQPPSVGFGGKGFQGSEVFPGPTI